MGLFDRFKKRVKEVAEEVDSEALTAMEDSEEGVAAIESSKHVEEDWEDDVPEIEGCDYDSHAKPHDEFSLSGPAS